MDNLEYGQWCTVGGKRYMIVDWTKWTVVVNTSEVNALAHTMCVRKSFDKSVVSEVSDFMTTDAERKAAGLSF